MELIKRAIEFVVEGREPLQNVLRLISDDVPMVQISPNGGYTGSKNFMYTGIAQIVYSSQRSPSLQCLRILDLGAGDGPLLKYLVEDSRFKGTEFLYKAVEKNKTMREALEELSATVKQNAPNLVLQKTTERGADVMDYFQITQDYGNPYDIINSQLLLHYLSPVQIGVFLECTRRLLAEDGVMFLSIQSGDALAGSYLLTGNQSHVRMDSMSEEFLKWLLDAFGFTSDFVVSTAFLSSSFIIGAVGGVVQKKEIDSKKMEEAKKELREAEKKFFKYYRPA